MSEQADLTALIVRLITGRSRAKETSRTVYVYPSARRGFWEWRATPPEQNCIVCHPSEAITFRSATAGTYKPAEPMTGDLIKCLMDAESQAKESEDDLCVYGNCRYLEGGVWVQDDWRIAGWVPAGSIYLHVWPNRLVTLEIAPIQEEETLAIA